MSWRGRKRRAEAPRAKNSTSSSHSVCPRPTPRQPGARRAGARGGRLLGDGVCAAQGCSESGSVASEPLRLRPALLLAKRLNSGASRRSVAVQSELLCGQ
eukprot:2691376-Rhodomonas_salina.1